MAEETKVEETKTTTTTVVEETAAPKVEAKSDAPAKENTVPQSRLDKVVAEKWEATRARQELERQLELANLTIEEFKKQKGDAGGGGGERSTPAMSPAELQRAVAAQAEVLRFNEQCNEVAKRGKAAHSDFDDSIAALKKTSPFFDPRAGGPVLPQSLIEAALETGQAEEVLYVLGKDTNEADRIMQLSPIRQAVEIAKFASKLEAGKAKDEQKDEHEDTEEEASEEEASESAPRVSRAPPPIKPAPSRGARPAFSIYDTKNTSTDEWVKNRQREVNEARKNGVRMH